MTAQGIGPGKNLGIWFVLKSSHPVAMPLSFFKFSVFTEKKNALN